LSAGTAHAQSAATCSFSADTRVLTVNVNGLTANITRTVGGQIRLNGADCTGATVTSTDLIQVNGGDFNDPVVVSGTYTPGFTTEGVGADEIEWVYNLGPGIDNLRINVEGVPSTTTFTASGVDVANDGDEDITTAGTEKVRIYSSTGNDTIDGTLYTGGGTLALWGGGGDDIIYGSVQNDSLYGQAGNDTLYGADGADRLYGGTGNDVYYGDAGNDTFWQEAAADGDDEFFGGAGIDTLNYQKRINGVTVTIGNGLADDGETGEFDAVDADVENVTGGGGNDVLVGSLADNTLMGNDGDDELYGGAGRDELRAGNGADILVGDAGPDKLFGDAGADSLDGGTGNDTLTGGAGNDTLTGGAGTDQFFGETGNDVFFNNDGVAETVDCGGGTADDPEPDGLDTFVACELI
jgi:Ca2+-binding RTX toxin-like protein